MRRVTAVIVILALSLCAGAAGLAQQDPKPAKAAKAAKRPPKPVSLEEALRPLIGMKCTRVASGGTIFLNFGPRPTHTLDMVGKDFVRLSQGGWKTYYPFTSIQGVSMR